MRSRSLLVVPVLLAGLLGACGGGDDDTASAPSGGDPAGPVAPAPGGGLVTAGVAHVVGPEGDEPLTITVVDLRAVADANGVEPPVDDASAEDLDAWLTAVLGGPSSGGDGASVVSVPPIPFLGLGDASAAEIRDELGIPLVDVATVVAAESVPYHFAVVSGDVDAGSLGDADLDDLGDGILSAGAGDDHETDPDGVTAVRRAGVPVRLTATDGRIALSTSTPALTAWRADGGDGGDDPAVAGVAAALDDDAVISALVVRQDLGAAFAPVGGQAPEPTITVPFTALGLGWGVDGGETAISVAYAFADDAAAAEAAPQVEQVWVDGELSDGTVAADHVRVEQVEADGSVVVARLRLVDDARPELPYDMLLRRDVTIRHA